MTGTISSRNDDNTMPYVAEIGDIVQACREHCENGGVRETVIDEPWNYIQITDMETRDRVYARFGEWYVLNPMNPPSFCWRTRKLRNGLIIDEHIHDCAPIHEGFPVRSRYLVRIVGYEEPAGQCELYIEHAQLFAEIDHRDRFAEWNATLEIAPRAFSHAKHLVTVVFDCPVHSIKESAFEGAESLREVYISSLTFLNQRAFAHCTSLEMVEIHDLHRDLKDCPTWGGSTVPTPPVLEDRCFADCHKLRVLYISSQNKRLDVKNDCFIRCHTLGNLYLPKDTDYRRTVLFNPASLEDTIAVRPNELVQTFPAISAKDIPGLSYLDTTLRRYTGSQAHFRIPEGFSAIAENAFANNKSIEHVYIPDTVVSIGDGAFHDCFALRNVYLPDNEPLKTIRASIFNKGCFHLTWICWSSGTEAADIGTPKLPEQYRAPESKTPAQNDALQAQKSPYAPDEGDSQITNSQEIWAIPALVLPTNDPDDLFDMMPPVERTAIQRIPQIMLHAILNRCARGDHYQAQTAILRTCFRFARILIANRDDRAERLFILEALHNILEKLQDETPAQILPYAFTETLIAICGRGNLRRYHDRNLLHRVSQLLGSSSIDGKPLQDLLFDEFHIGPAQPERYNPQKTQSILPIQIDTIDYAAPLPHDIEVKLGNYYEGYTMVKERVTTFPYEMDILLDSVFGRGLPDPNAVWNHFPDPNPDNAALSKKLGKPRDVLKWCCREWNRAIREQLSPDMHLVCFIPHDLETNPWQHDTNYGFLAIISKAQLDELRVLLAKCGLEGMMAYPG